MALQPISPKRRKFRTWLVREHGQHLHEYIRRFYIFWVDEWCHNQHYKPETHKALGGINPSTATAATICQDTVHTIHAWILSTSSVFLILPDMNYEPLLIIHIFRIVAPNRLVYRRVIAIILRLNKLLHRQWSSKGLLSIVGFMSKNVVVIVQKVRILGAIPLSLKFCKAVCFLNLIKILRVVL
jgi:hypothetical protein